MLISKHAFTGDGRGKEQPCKKMAAFTAHTACVGHTAHERSCRCALQPTESFMPATPSPSHVTAKSLQGLGAMGDSALYSSWALCCCIRTSPSFWDLRGPAPDCHWRGRNTWLTDSSSYSLVWPESLNWMGKIPVCEPSSCEQAGGNGEEERTSCFSVEVYFGFHLK